MPASRYYLDHNATSPPAPAVTAALGAFLVDPPANAGSVHRAGQRARALLEGARQALSQALDLGGYVAFTSGATEANNSALRGLEYRRLITSRLEHPSVVATAGDRAAAGRELLWLGNDDRGCLDLGELAGVLREGDLVSVCAANSVLGNRNPIDAIAALCAERGALMHVDAAQVFGRFECRLPTTISALTLSAHKAGGPAGIGALWVADRRGFRAQSVGGHQERGVRAGTEPVALAAAWAALLRDQPGARWAHCAEIRDAIESAVISCGGRVLGSSEARLPNTLCASVPGLHFEALVMACDMDGLEISAGSACTAGSMEASPVVAALGLRKELLDGAFRISVGPSNQQGDVAEINRRLVRVIERLKGAQA